MRKLHPVEVTAHDQAARHALPEAVAAALGELVGAAQEGLLALSVDVGLGVLESLMEEKRTALVGPRSKPNAERTAVRRPRPRSADGSNEGEAHIALGYSSWREYWQVEFETHWRTGYRQLDAARFRRRRRASWCPCSEKKVRKQ